MCPVCVSLCTVAQASSTMSESTHSGATLRATSPPRDACAPAAAESTGAESTCALESENVARANTMPAADAPQQRAPSSVGVGIGMETDTASRSPASFAESDDVLWSSSTAAQAATAGAAAVLCQRQGAEADSDDALADNGPSKARARYGSDQWSTASAI